MWRAEKCSGLQRLFRTINRRNWQAIFISPLKKWQEKGMVDMKNLFKKLKSKQGFSILEVMVSIIILTMSLIFLLNMAMVALDANDWSNKATMSTQLIQEKLEELRTSLALTNGIDTVNNIQRQWTVTNVNSYLRQIDITASWENSRGDTLQNSISTMIRVN
jgi:type II secretory pathway pseudopilin PulG